MKTRYMVIGLILIAYLVLVILHNIIERNNYKDCAAESITEAQAATLSYGGNVRNDKLTPRACSDNNGLNTFEERNIFSPSVFQ